MMKTFHGAFGLVGILLLAGCSWLPFFGTEDEPDAYTIVKQLQESASVDQAVAARMKELPIRVNYAFKSKPLADHELLLEVEYMALKDLARLQLGYRSSEGLALVQQPSDDDFKDLKRFDIINQQLIVVPKEETHYTINIFVVTKEGDDQRGRQITIPVALGKFSLEPAPPTSENL